MQKKQKQKKNNNYLVSPNMTVNKSSINSMSSKVEYTHCRSWKKYWNFEEYQINIKHFQKVWIKIKSNIFT